ncbi:MAG TPA: hypothetical protein VFX70_21450 [Mycobacteriales bacterium]|nr:hypothetical protein [Mycobacteriales bacterium]
MFDEVHLGWLAGDDYRRAGAVEDRGSARFSPDKSAGSVLDELLTGRWVDDDPPTVPTGAGR